ncbi:hypothetical protein DVH24_040060 [Malus domestica]|uniref:Uncharacterized protein n=1 Tax=Malus domestica TaxID=3750 RepID=A0A498I5B0_MALDO|nr:hypothetical protein DVH24_040060 [Malus domestica]
MPRLQFAVRNCPPPPPFTRQNPIFFLYQSVQTTNNHGDQASCCFALRSLLHRRYTTVLSSVSPRAHQFNGTHSLTFFFFIPSDPNSLNRVKPNDSRRPGALCHRRLTVAPTTSSEPSPVPTASPTGETSIPTNPPGGSAMAESLSIIMNGRVEEMIQGLNFASADAGIIFTSGSELGQHVSFSQQVQQFTDTYQQFIISLGEQATIDLVSNSVLALGFQSVFSIHIEAGN